MTLFDLKQKPIPFQILVFLIIWFFSMLIFVLSGPIVAQLISGVDPATAMKDLDNITTAGISSMKWYQFMSQIFIYGIPPVLFAAFHGPSIVGFFNDNRSSSSTAKYNAGSLTLVGVGLMIFLLGIGGVIKQIDLGSEAQALQQRREAMEGILLKMDSIPSMIINVLLIGFVPAICEELFFRGFVQQYLSKLIPNKGILPVIITAILFASVHGSIYNFAPIIIAGTVLGLVYYWTKDIKANTVVHLINNGLQVILIYFVGHNSQLTSMMESSTAAYISSIIGAVLLCVGMKLIYNTHSKFKSI